AMFREGQIAFAEAMAMPDDDVEPGEPTRARLRLVAKRFFDFCTADTARYQLMFQRVIPDFEPSPDSYALAVDHLEKTRDRVRAGRKWGKAHGRPMVDGVGAVRIAERSGVPDAALAARVRAVFPRGLKGRTMLPARLRRNVKMSIEVPGTTEKWRLGYL